MAKQEHIRVVIPKKPKGTCQPDDIASDEKERVIEGRGKYAVVLAARISGIGFETHTSEKAAIALARRMRKQGFPCEIIDQHGNILDDQGGKLILRSDKNKGGNQ